MANDATPAKISAIPVHSSTGASLPRDCLHVKGGIQTAVGGRSSGRCRSVWPIGKRLAERNRNRIVRDVWSLTMRARTDKALGHSEPDWPHCDHAEISRASRLCFPTALVVSSLIPIHLGPSYAVAWLFYLPLVPEAPFCAANSNKFTK